MLHHASLVLPVLRGGETDVELGDGIDGGTSALEKGEDFLALDFIDGHARLTGLAAGLRPLLRGLLALDGGELGAGGGEERGGELDVVGVAEFGCDTLQVRGAGGFDFTVQSGGLGIEGHDFRELLSD